MSTLFRVLLVASLAVPASGGHTNDTVALSLTNSLVWGPGLDSQFVVPVRYIFVQLKDIEGNNVSSSVGDSPFVVLLTERDVGHSGKMRIYLQQLDRHDGSYIVRYRMHHTYRDLTLSITYKGTHVGKSPYTLPGLVYHDTCPCAVQDIDAWLQSMHCPATYSQIDKDLKAFPSIVFSNVVTQVWQRFNKSGSHSLCRYLIRNNKLYRSTMGKHVGFKMFSDAILLSLMRKVRLPDMEFYINLGDWPLEARAAHQGPLPILSWCGSHNTMDIVMPTYDVTESTLETMGRCENTTKSLEMPTYDMEEEQLSNSCRVTLDLMSVQANTPVPWKDRKEMVFWRGRDSRQERLDLVKMSKRNPTLIDAKLTNMFFFKHNKEELGELVKHISFFSFFDYKYQINVDGTVAAYRLPYLLAGGSLVLKQQSQYYEHFYNDLQPYVHYVPLKADLSDLQEKVQWAKDNDDKARQIAANARQYVVDHLLAKDVFCYHVLLLKKYAALLKEVPAMEAAMEAVSHPEDRFHASCNCHRDDSQTKDEL